MHFANITYVFTTIFVGDTSMPLIEVGKKAPAFSLKDHSGKKHSLKDYLGKKVVLYFYPKDLTPGCTIQACDFTDNIKKYATQNTVVLGVSADSEELHKKFIDKHELKIILLSDEEKKVCEKYGIWQEKKNYGKSYMGIVRTTYIIDEKGKVVKVYKSVRAKGHVEKVLEDLKEL